MAGVVVTGAQGVARPVQSQASGAVRFKCVCAVLFFILYKGEIVISWIVWCTVVFD